ncbi:MAG: YitT family protein, partial [Paracoccaceae bacterium]|nr:YitT family protein [Paracoccaceae bacterium]
NLPFYVLAYRRLGPMFTVKSLISVTLLSLVTTLLPYGWQMGEITPWLGALLAGCTIGIGLMAMFRHNGSLGGFGVLALVIQDSTGFRAGYVQLIIDAVLFGIAFFILPTSLVLWSLLGAVTVNAIIAVNHRPDRYVAR